MGVLIIKIFSFLVLIASAAMAQPQSVEMQSLTKADLQVRMLRLALEQAEQPTGYWDPGQRDCAGFVRFLYRNILGVNVWKNRKQELKAFLSADELLSYNFELLGKSHQHVQLESGDLLAYYNPNNARKDAWHLMLYFENPKGANRPLLIYHNGDSGAAARVRKVWFDNLLVENSKWQPKFSNPLFVGFYRYKDWQQHKR